MGHLPPPPPLKTVGGKGGIMWKYKPAVHLPFFRCFSEMLARLIKWKCMQTRMKASEPYLLNLIDLRKKGKERNKETKK